jgi:hypothetical protein
MIFKLRLSFLFNDVAPKAIFDAQYFTHDRIISQRGKSWVNETKFPRQFLSGLGIDFVSGFRVSG